MKTQFRLIIAAFSIVAISFTSCNKDKTESNNNSDYTSQLSSQTDDQAQVSEETDALVNDANDILDDHPSMNGRITRTICDATVVVDSLSDPRTITITYNGSNCAGNRIRTGVITLSIPQGVHWDDAGAVITITITNLHITRLRDNRSITINGTITCSNITGGRLRDLAMMGAGATIVHEIASPGITITFDNNSNRTWQVAKRRVFSYDNGIVITTTGTHTDGNITGISEWGANRFGNSFVTSITQPLIVRQDCGMRITSGTLSHDRLIADVVVTFGLDAQGLATGCPGLNESYYLKLVWTGANGNVRTVIMPY